MTMDMATAKAPKKRKAGRPPLPPGVAKHTMLRLLANPAEVELLDSVCARHGLNRSEAIRRAIHILSMYPTLMPPEPPTMWQRRPSVVVSAEDIDALYGPGTSTSTAK